MECAIKPCTSTLYELKKDDFAYCTLCVEVQGRRMRLVSTTTKKSEWYGPESVAGHNAQSCCGPVVYDHCSQRLRFFGLHITCRVVMDESSFVSSYWIIGLITPLGGCRFQNFVKL